MAVRGAMVLAKAGVAYDLVEYDHRKKGAEFAARSVGAEPHEVIKSLVARLADGRFVFALMPADRDLSKKKLAAAFGARGAELADERDAQRLTGYLVGGISPLGSRKRLPVAIHDGLMSRGRVLVNAGARGKLVRLTPEDLRNATDAKVLPLGIDCLPLGGFKPPASAGSFQHSWRFLYDASPWKSTAAAAIQPSGSTCTWYGARSTARRCCAGTYKRGFGTWHDRSAPTWA